MIFKDFKLIWYGNMPKIPFQTIGFIAYKLDGDKEVNLSKEPVSSHFFKTHRSVARSDFVNSREVTKRAKLPPGQYIIVPCTFQVRIWLFEFFFLFLKFFEIVLKFFWNFLKFFWKYFENVLNFLWNLKKKVLKMFRNFFKNFVKIFWTFFLKFFFDNSL